MYLPLLLSIYGAYKAGIEEGKKRHFKNHRRKNQRRNNYVGDKVDKNCNRYI